MKAATLSITSQMVSALALGALAPMLSGCLGAVMAVQAIVPVVQVAVEEIGSSTSRGSTSTSRASQSTSQTPSGPTRTIYCIDDRLSISYIRVNSDCVSRSFSQGGPGCDPRG